MSIDKGLLLDRLGILRLHPSEDAVLDLMDDVDGWCSPHRRLDPDPLWVEPDDNYFYRLETPHREHGNFIRAYLVVLALILYGVTVGWLLRSAL